MEVMWLTPTQAAVRCGYKPASWRTMQKTNPELMPRSINTGKGRRFKAEWVDEWMLNGGFAKEGK